MTDKPIDKVEAAGRQLDGACRFRLANEDSLIVHTLGYAAFGILSDLVRHRDHPMNDVLDILQDRASKMWREFRGVPNFLKHADTDPDGMLMAHTPDTAHLTLALGVLLWVELRNQPTEAMQKVIALPNPYMTGYRASAFLKLAQEPPGAQYKGEGWQQRLSRLTVTSS
jgi:hypothetical protein